MREDRTEDGWLWPDNEEGPRQASDDRLAGIFARCFSNEDGRAVLFYLRGNFLLRRISPRASEAELRHVEGQRALVAHIQGLIIRGRAGKA